MQVESLIQGSANIIRVTTLVKGNVYKRYDKPSYGEGKMVYGIVTEIMHNGDLAIVQTTEFKPSYHGLDIELKTFAGGDDITIYPATQAELKVYLEDAAGVARRKVDEAQKALTEAREKQVQVQQILDGTFAQELTVPETSGLTALEADRLNEPFDPADEYSDDVNYEAL